MFYKHSKDVVILRVKTLATVSNFVTSNGIAHSCIGIGLHVGQNVSQKGIKIESCYLLSQNGDHFGDTTKRTLNT